MRIRKVPPYIITQAMIEAHKAGLKTLTRDELEGAQMAIAKQQQDLQALNDQLMNEFAMEQAKFNNQLRDSIQAFLKEYNKDKKFDFIIS